MLPAPRDYAGRGQREGLSSWSDSSAARGACVHPAAENVTDGGSGVKVEDFSTRLAGDWTRGYLKTRAATLGLQRARHRPKCPGFRWVDSDRGGFRKVDSLDSAKESTLAKS